MAKKTISYENNSFNIAYKIINNNANKNMLFLHGWGSNKELMEMAFGKCFNDFNHIYVDLPGFGGSESTVFLDSIGYGGVICAFLEHICINDICDVHLVVGHSFGGKIALLLDREIILLSSAGILLKKSMKIKMKILLAKILKNLGISKIIKQWLVADDAKNLSPVMYEIFKHVVNEDFAPYYRDFRQRASIFWGESDSATPLEAFEKIKSLMPDSRTHVLKGDHYFFLKQGAQIERLYREDT